MPGSCISTAASAVVGATEDIVACVAVNMKETSADVSAKLEQSLVVQSRDKESAYHAMGWCLLCAVGESTDATSALDETI